MDPILLIFIVIIVLVGGFIVLKNFKNSSFNELQPKQETEKKSEIANNLTNELQVQFNMLSEIQEIDESRLVEIKDNKLLGKINNLIPETFKTATTIDNAIQDTTKKIYEVVIPSGEKLVNSKDMEGAVRGFYSNSK